MTPFDMGRVSAFLQKHRSIEYRTDKRGLRKDERELAELLRDSPMDSMNDLCELLNGYGFELITLTTFDVSGIGSGERVFLLVRKSNVECPLLDLPRAAERMEPTSGRATVGKIWLTQFWLPHLDLIYTQRDRSPDERNKWIDATFTKDMLVQSMREHINDRVRRLDPEQVADNEVYDALTAEKGADLARYAKRFLDLMVDAGLLDDKGNGVYRQSLLSAVEMKENYARVLAPLMVQARDASTATAYGALTHALLSDSIQAQEQAQ